MDVYELRADMIKALAHPMRLRIIDILDKRGETCVCDLAEEVHGSQSTVSKHLSVLRRAGVVTNHKEGLTVYYSLRLPCLTKFLVCVDGVLLADAEAKQQGLNSLVQTL